MDWVKPKQRARQRKRQTQATAEITAGTWLKQLCDENVALLQASLPIDAREKKLSKNRYSIESYVNAISWGAGIWETESDQGLSKLQDFVHAFGNTFPSSKNRKAKSLKDSLSPTQIACAKNVGHWITKQLPRASYDPYAALISAGWIHALPHVGREITPALWLEVLQSIMTQVDRAWESEAQDDLFPWLVWSCEIPLALAKQLSHLGGKDRIVSDSLNRIAQVLEESASNPGRVLQRGGQDLRAIIGSLIRSRWAASEVGARKWYPPQRKALGKLAQYALSLTDSKGKQLLCDEADTTFEIEFWTSIFELSDQNKKLMHTLACALPDECGKAIGLKPAKLRRDSTLDTSLWKQSHYCEASSIATMRPSWRHAGNRIALDFSSDVIWFDLLGDDGSRIFSGDWDCHVQRDGQQLHIDNAWEELCWFSDDDVDYIELECSIDEVCKIQRQVMLMREEGVVYLADALLAQDVDQWTLKSTWDVANGLQLRHDSQMSECWLVRPNPELENELSVALILPVSFPEWRRQKSPGMLSQWEEKLEMSTTAYTKRIYNPLVIALKDLDKPLSYTWRQLTIAEDLRIQPRDIAEAYRVQINRDQWVFYRSLTPCTRRTVMGLHLNNEFYAGRFSASDGQFEAMIEVSQENE